MRLSYHRSAAEARFFNGLLGSQLPGGAFAGPTELAIVPPMRINEGEVARLAEHGGPRAAQAGVRQSRRWTRSSSSPASADCCSTTCAPRRSSSARRSSSRRSSAARRRDGSAQDRRRHQGAARQRTGFYTVIRFSEGRLSYLAHQIVADAARARGWPRSRTSAWCWPRSSRRSTRSASSEAKLDEIVRRKIASLSRQVPPGSREWDVLYQRYLEEEHRKQKS